MRTIEVYRVVHHEQERGGARFRYASNPETAQVIAEQHLGWYGGTGHADEYPTTIEVFETPAEVAGWIDEQERLRTRRDELAEELELIKSRIR